MKTTEVKNIYNKMIQAIKSEFKNWSFSEKVKCPSLKKMAAYINTIFPELDAKVESWSEYKGRKAGRIYYSGQSYYGNRLTVKDKNIQREIIQHESTETYRVNTDVAKNIIFWQEQKMYGFAEKKGVTIC